jgi:hypothetical protein
VAEHIGQVLEGDSADQACGEGVAEPVRAARKRPAAGTGLPAAGVGR